MATARQISANRRNAALSTGPTTEEGKARSRRNALTHSLTGAGVVVGDADVDAIAERLDAWRAELRPSSPHQEWLLRQVVVSSLRVEHCQELEADLRAYRAGRAAACWDADRSAEVEELAAGLHRRPSLVVARLSRTRHGCDWLLARWEALGAALEENGTWSDEQIALALDLLGVPPALRGSGRPGADEPPDALVARERARLERLKADGLDDLDATERALTEEGRAVMPDREQLRLQRYEAVALRVFHRSLDQLLRRGESGEARPPEDDPEPTAAPASAEPPPAPDDDQAEPADPPIPFWPDADALPVATTPAPSPASPSPPPLNRRARRAEMRRARSRR
jgi:hypothetical protein